VKINEAFCLLFGVPQGSLLGPILFILYIKFLQEIAKKYGLDVQFYADDSQLYISFYPSRPSELDDVVKRTNECLQEIKCWMVKNSMKLNDDKTEVLIIGKPLVLRRFDLSISIEFGGEVIAPTPCKGDSWKSLGVKLDEALNMERQINWVKQKCSWTMMNLRTIGCYLDQEVKLMLVKQLVISKIDYCNALYMNVTKTRLKKLTSVLNNGIRFIYNIHDRSENLLPYYKKAHILPIKDRVFFKVCLLCYKIVNDMAPQYLKELIAMYTPICSSRSTRTWPLDDNLKMVIPKMSKTLAGDRRFTNYAPVAWNSLPLEIRSITHMDAFKARLKNRLYLLMED